MQNNATLNQPLDRFVDPFSSPDGHVPSVNTTADANAVTDVDAHVAVDDLEDAMRRQLVTVELETLHHFAPGVYARELHIPAGTLLTGKVHRTRHLNIVSQGRITVWSIIDGARTISAPATFASDPGTRRVGFAHTDTVWTTIHPTDETNLDKLEELLIQPRPARCGVPTVDAQIDAQIDAVEQRALASLVEAMTREGER